MKNFFLLTYVNFDEREHCSNFNSNSRFTKQWEFSFFVVLITLYLYKAYINIDVKSALFGVKWTALIVCICYLRDEIDVLLKKETGLFNNNQQASRELRRRFNYSSMDFILLLLLSVY